MKFKTLVKTFLVIMIFAVMGLIFSAECWATEATGKYVGNYDRCIAESGGRGGIESVQWACAAAARALQQGCSLWIGSVNSSTVPEITVFSKEGVTPIMYWGMCSEGTDWTSQVWVNNDNDSIDDNKSVFRLAQPAVGSAATTLDIGRFIVGASAEEVNECETKYTRTVMVGRRHSYGGSESEMPQTITVRVIEGDNCNEGNTCDDWMPASYPGSNMYHGVTTIDIRIRNPRLGGWWDMDIWAMPTDLILWIACYYPGVQRTSDTDVGSLNGADIGYPLEYDGIALGYRGVGLPNYTCMRNMPIQPVEYEPLYVKVNKVSKWENKFIMSGDADQYYEGSWTRGDDTVRYNIVSKQTHEGDAGSTFTETAETGTPVEATIDVHKPETDFRQCTCEKWYCAEPGWNPDLGDCVYYTTEGVCYEHEGDWDWSEGYCEEDAWDTATCSCCTEDWGDGFAQTGNSGINGKAPCSGANCETGTTNTYEKTLNDATVTFGPVSDSLSVRLPYNFITSTDLSIDRGLVYSGHSDQIRVNRVTTTVHQRYNGVTVATYATQVPGASINLYAYVAASAGGGLGESLGSTGDICAILGDEAKQCVYLRGTSRTLNAGGSLGGATDTIWSGLTYNAFDAAAGDYMCFASSVSPYSVAGDTDMAGGDGVWAISNPKCAIIAKKPSFQVWGGSLYSVGSITAKYNSKVNVYNEYKSNIQDDWKRNGGTNIHFTPWVEESLILKNGTTNTVASGAAAGLNNNVAGVGTSTVFCNDRAALSFANYSGTIGSLCNGAGTVGASGISSGIADRADLIEYWTGTGSLAGVNTWAGTWFDLSYPYSVGQQIESATGSKIRYAYSNGDINLYGTVPTGTTYLIKSDGTVTIAGDLRYSGAYTEFSQIPKVIIYARNVNISCNATEVDAIIVTGKGGSGNVNTCYDGGDVNSSFRSRQLKIFGMVITDTINMERTYGAAANDGNNTDAIGIPADGAAAEIFDYDSSILMWSEFMAGSNESDTLQTVYQHELAPRY